MNIRRSTKIAVVSLTTIGSLILPVGVTSAAAAPPRGTTPTVADVASGMAALADAPALPAGTVETLIEANQDVLAARSGIGADVPGAIGWDLGAGNVVVRLPFSPAGGLRPESAVTAQFAPGEDPVVMEVVLTERSDTSGRVETWANGTKIVDEVVSDSSAPVKQAKGAKWDRFVQCLNNAGVPAWIVTGISLACSVACAATLGVGCAVCLGAAAAGFSGTVSFCIAWARG